jgi:hypothetical protein
MGMDRAALLARFALSLRTLTVTPPSKPLEALSDDELRQLLFLAEG